MPLIETKGAASAQGFGQFAKTGEAVYIESVFQTWLYTGNGSASRAINNGIDLSTKGGLVWTKDRTQTQSHELFDTARGVTKSLTSNSSNGQLTSTNYMLSFNTGGYTIGDGSEMNLSADNFVSWTFRKQPKFFDVVTYTGNGTGPRAIPHSLGSTPGVAILKKTSTTSDWIVTDPGGAWGFYGAQPLYLNNTNAREGFNQTGVFSADATSIYVGANTFSTGTNFGSNDSGVTYVAYLFAHNAGGFGLTGTDNVISCGSYTGNGSATGPTVTLGYEPQWVLIKNATFSGAGWLLFDNMRGMTVTDDAALFANTSGSEFVDQYIAPTATGFNVQGTYTAVNGNGDTMVYIAIRRGPMKTPTTGTSVFTPIARTGTGSATTISGVGFAADLLWDGVRNTAGYGNFLLDKLRGGSQRLGAYTTAAEVTETTAPVTQFGNTSVNISGSGTVNDSGVTYVNWLFQRAPGFFDVVCYTGNNVYQQAQSHNLGVAPELIIVKRRNATANWAVGCNFTNTEFQYLNLNSGADGGNTNAYTTGGFFGGRPTATTFILAQNSITNASGGTYVAYLFATLAGVSKVGTYTGTGALQTINCGFTSGARFVLIKRLGDNVDPGTGDWYVYDSARGITSGNDPYLLMNSTAAEVTGTNYVDTTSVGFQVTAAAPAGLNASGGTYLFLAVA